MSYSDAWQWTGRILREDVDDLYGGVPPVGRAVVEPDGTTTAPIEQHPVEDPLDDPNHQVPDEGLPDPISGNDDEDDEGEDDGTA